MIIHTFTNSSGAAFLVKVEQGTADGGRDKFSVTAVSEKGQSAPLRCVFHGSGALDMFLREMQEALNKYQAFLQRQNRVAVDSPRSITLQ